MPISNLVYIPIEDSYTFLVGLVQLFLGTIGRQIEKVVNGHSNYIGNEANIARIEILKIEIEINKPNTY